MPKIVNCIECRSIVSDSANNCPKCGTSRFKGVICVGCNRLSKETEVKGNPTGYIHKHCEDKISHEEVDIGEILPNLSFHCSACHQKQFINEKTQERFKYHITGIEYLRIVNQFCKYCGHENKLDTNNHSFAYCCFCSHGLATNKSVKLKSEDGEKTVFSHRFCYDSRGEKMKTIAFLKTIALMLYFLAVVLSPTIAGMMFFRWGIEFIPSFLTGGAIFLTGMIVGGSVGSASDEIQKKLWQKWQN